MTTTADLKPASPGHLLHFYRDPAELASVVGAYLVEGLTAGESVVILATSKHTRLISEQIEGAGFDAIELMKSGTLIMLDAFELLDSFMVDGMPDPDLFDAVIGSMLRDLSGRSGGVRAFGELVAVLWQKGAVDAVIELESLWNGLLAALDIGLFCAYPSDVAESEKQAEVLQICHHHDEVSGFETPPNGASLTAQAAFPMSKQSSVGARRFTVKTLRGWECDHLAPDASSIVTELVTNAVLHARSHFSLTLTKGGGVVRISVRDDSRAMPATVDIGSMGEGGRGLMLVDALADRWDVEVDDSGKIVWAELDEERGAEGAQSA